MVKPLLETGLPEKHCGRLVCICVYSFIYNKYDETKTWKQPKMLVVLTTNTGQVTTSIVNPCSASCCELCFSFNHGVLGGKGHDPKFVYLVPYKCGIFSVKPN